MNKINKKRTFLISFIALIIFLSGMVVSLYDNVEGKFSQDENIIINHLNSEIKYFTIAKAKEADPGYQILSFGKDVPNEIREYLTEKLEENMTDALDVLENDSNFLYEVKDINTKKTVKSKYLKNDIYNNDVKNNSVFYGILNYDAKGELTKNEALYKGDYDGFDFADMFEGSFDVGYTGGEDGTDNYYIKGVSVPQNQIKVNTPDNVSIAYSVPVNAKDNGGMVYYYLSSWENYNSFAAGALMFGSFIIALFILFYPKSIEDEVNPFKSFRKLRGEINIGLIATAITFGCMGCLIVSGYSINGMFLSLVNTLGFTFSGFIVMLCNIIVWALTFLVIAIGCYDLKYIVVDGIWRFLRDDTLIGDLCRNIKRGINKLSDVDLSDDLNKTIMKYALINTLVILIMICLWWFGIFLAFIYAIVSYLWIKEKVDKVKADYDVLLTSTENLAKGNFNDEITEDVGVFNSLKDEFKNIKTGFEEAVKEETKSQNMRTELISNVSHDLKTPLTGIKNYVELLQQDSISEETRKEYVETLNQYIDRLSTLIEDLFEVSKVNSGNINLDLMELNLIQLIEQTKDECSEVLSSKGLEMIMTSANSEIPLMLDGDKTYRIFENLFNNVAKYALPSTRVYIDIAESEEDVMVEIKNISASQMNFTSEEIVERFVRGDKSRHESGSGIGLAIVKSYVEAQGGSFKIDIDGDLFKAIIIFCKDTK